MDCTNCTDVYQYMYSKHPYLVGDKAMKTQSMGAIKKS